MFAVQHIRAPIHGCLNNQLFGRLIDESDFLKKTNIDSFVQKCFDIISNGQCNAT